MPEFMQTTTFGAGSRAEPATHAAAPPVSGSECSVPLTARSRGGGGGGGPMLGCPTSTPPSEVEAPLAHLRTAQNHRMSSSPCSRAGHHSRQMVCARRPRRESCPSIASQAPTTQTSMRPSEPRPPRPAV